MSWIGAIRAAKEPKKKNYRGKPSIQEVIETHKRIKALRAEGKSRLEIAEILGLHGQTVWKHLTGKIKCAEGV